MHSIRSGLLIKVVRLIRPYPRAFFTEQPLCHFLQATRADGLLTPSAILFLDKFPLQLIVFGLVIENRVFPFLAALVRTLGEARNLHDALIFRPSLVPQSPSGAAV